MSARFYIEFFFRPVVNEILCSLVTGLTSNRRHRGPVLVVFSGFSVDVHIFFFCLNDDRIRNRYQRTGRPTRKSRAVDGVFF